LISLSLINTTKSLIVAPDFETQCSEQEFHETTLDAGFFKLRSWRTTKFYKVRSQ